MKNKPDGPQNLQRLCDLYNARPDHNHDLRWIVAGTHIRLIEARDYRAPRRKEAA